MDKASVFETGGNEVCSAETRARQVGIVEARLLQNRADEIGPLQISTAQISASKCGTIHLDAPQIKP